MTHLEDTVAMSDHGFPAKSRKKSAKSWKILHFKKNVLFKGFQKKYLKIWYNHSWALLSENLAGEKANR